jgi:predicted MFS family arabinose efflux permease
MGELDSAAEHAAPLPPGSATELGGKWASFAVPQYRWLWAGSAASFLSVQMMFVARGWLAWELTQSSLAIGAVYLVFGAVLLVGMPIGGVAADRVAKRALLRVSSAVMAASQLIMSGLVMAEVVELWMLLVVAFVQGASFSVIAPARISISRDIVGPRLLSNAIVLQQIAMNTTRVFGPSAAGLILFLAPSDRAGIAATFLITGLIMLLAFVSTFFLPLGLPAGDLSHSPRRDLADGVAYVRRRPPLLALVLTSLLVTMVAFPYVALLPQLADDVFGVGGSGFGFLMAIGALGGVSAAFYSADRADGPTAGRLQTLFGFAFGAGLLVMATAPGFAWAILPMMLLGFAATGFQALNNTLALRDTDPAYHGRVQGLLMMSFGAFGVAAMPLGALADAIGVRPTIALMGVAAVLVMCGYLLWGHRSELITDAVDARAPATAAGGVAAS